MALESLMNTQNISDSLALATCFVRANPNAIEGSDVSQLVARLVKNFSEFKGHELISKNNNAMVMWAKRTDTPGIAHALLWEALKDHRDKKYEWLLSERIYALALLNKRQPLNQYGTLAVRALHAFAGGGKLQSFVVSGSTKFIEIAGARTHDVRKSAPKPIERGHKLDVDSWENDENIFVMDDL